MYKEYLDINPEVAEALKLETSCSLRINNFPWYAIQKCRNSITS